MTNIEQIQESVAALRRDLNTYTEQTREGMAQIRADTDRIIRQVEHTLQMTKALTESLRNIADSLQPEPKRKRWLRL